jgi:hypothetical protein
MPKYKVTLIDKIFYEICVEAEDEDEAEEMAQDLIDDAEIISESYLEVVETEELK